MKSKEHTVWVVVLLGSRPEGEGAGGGADVEMLDDDEGGGADVEVLKDDEDVIEEGAIIVTVVCAEADGLRSVSGTVTVTVSQIVVVSVAETLAVITSVVTHVVH